MPYEGTKVDFFYIEEINGKKIDNSAIRTAVNNSGNGLNAMKLSMLDRQVPASPGEFKIVGRTQYSAPIQALFNPEYHVEGVVHFVPENGKTYVVTGDLDKESSAVWIEEETSHKLVSNKIEVKSGVVSAVEPLKRVEFPGGTTHFVATRPTTFSISIDMPVDVRRNYAALKVAGSDWNGCKVDSIWGKGAASAIRERLATEVADSRLFRQVISDGRESTDFHLKTEVRAFCADSRRESFVTYRGAGISTLDFTLERGGTTIWHRTIEKVVTDDQPDYSGSQFTTKKTAFTHLMADSLRVVIADMLPRLQEVTLATP